jgi:type VI secretion system protein ImpL
MSSFQTNQLKFALGLGGLFSFYGVVGLIVYMIPGGAVGIRYKIIIIALVLLTLPFALLIGFVASRKKKKKEAKALEAQSPQAAEGAPAAQPQKLATPAGSYAGITSGVEEVVQFLKSSNLGEGGKDAVYSLPWYIVAGAPHSGKTSLVVGSNLNFQTLPSQRQSEQKTVRPTGAVDWRVTSEGVFVDTAGRYQTEGVDADEWASLLETIKKYRSNRPLDGFLLVVDTEQILKNDERETEEMAKVLRSRLDEVMQRLKVRFPVYLIFTHADAIEGFRDSFSTSKGEDRNLVWGTTIPLEKSENAQALFDGEYEILNNSVMKRRLVRLSAPFPPVRQLRIFNFPLHFGSARRKLGAFVTALFRPNPFSENPFLRGYYFTAAPVGKAAPNAPQALNGTYFVERLFKDVILRDKDLVRTFLAQRQRPPIFGWFVTLLLGFLTLALLVMSGVSLVTNRQMLAEAKDKGEKMLTIVHSDAGKNTLDKKEDEVRRELNATDDLRTLLVKLDDYDRNGPPMYMRFGLYSGRRVYKQQLLPIYMGVVEQRFKAPTVKRVETELRKFAASQPVVNAAQLTDQEEQNLGKNYDLLKAYLMLSGNYKDKAEATHLANTLKDYWISESKIPADLNLTAQAQLDFWAKQVDRDDADYRFPRINPDAKLVDDVRKKLQAYPAWQRYYKRKVTEVSKQIDDTIGTTTATGILTRNGGDTSLIEGTYTVPSAFTKPAFELMKTAIADADQKLSEDDWVMGETGKNAVAQATDASKIEDRYYRDYADHWRNFVKGVTVKPYKNKDDAANALQTFSSSNSPMKILLTEIAKNTNLSAPPENPGLWGWIKSWFQSKTSSDTGGNTEVEKQFRPLFTFVGTKDQKDTAPIEKYQTEIGNVYKDFNGISQDRLKAIGQQMANDEDPIKLRVRETSISNLIKGFSETPSAQEVATLLQKPLGNLRTLLGAGEKDRLAKAWTEQIMPAAKEVEKGFPFDDSAGESDLTKLTAYLNPNDGKLSKFYKDGLEKYFEESNGQLKVKDTSDIKFTDEFVAYLNAAFSLRKALFGTSATPKFEYEFSFKPVKDALIEVTIDGQKVTSEGTAAMKGTFPAAASTETGVIMKFASTAGSASTPSAAPAANSNTSKFQPSSGEAAQTYAGTWGLFKFVEAGKPQKQAGGEYLLSYSLGGKAVSATIKPSGGDLFDKTIFRQFRAPQSFVK